MNTEMTVADTPNNDSRATRALVFSIIGLVCPILFFTPLFILSYAGIVFAILALSTRKKLKREPLSENAQGKLKVARILGIIGLILSILVIVITIALLIIATIIIIVQGIVFILELIGVIIGAIISVIVSIIGAILTGIGGIFTILLPNLFGPIIEQIIFTVITNVVQTVVDSLLEMFFSEIGLAAILMLIA